MDDLERQLSFLAEAERLKSVLREAWTSTGRQESTAEHSWRLALLAWLLAPKFPVDRERVLLMCLIHDLGELYMGDIPANVNADEAKKHAAEQRDAAAALSLLPAGQGETLMALWKEYNENATPEARLVKALDKAETILQHNQGKNPPGFDYDFNLDYGKAYFQGDLLERLRAILDAGTAGRMRQAGMRP